MKNKKAFTTEEIENLLGNRFCPPAWAFLPQVRRGTGYLTQIRTADAIAMGLWPSRGLELHGFEIKVYRGDWTKELGDPAKAEEIAQFCDFWWVVAPKELIKVEELPTPWGLMIPHGSTMKIVKQAEKLKSKSPDKPFLAAILRRVQESIAPEAKLRESFKKGEEEGEKGGKESFKWEREKHEELKETVATFEKASGVNLNTFQMHSIKEIGDAVRTVLNGEHLRARENLKDLLPTAEKIVSDIKENLGKIKS